MILSYLGQQNPWTIEKKDIEEISLIPDIDGTAVVPDGPEKMALRKIYG